MDLPKNLLTIVTLAVFFNQGFAQHPLKKAFTDVSNIYEKSSGTAGHIKDSVRLAYENKARDFSNSVKPSDDSLSPISPSLDSQGGGTEIPYPILFVHGLTGNGNTWQPMTDWLSPALGQAIDLKFSLNKDGSDYTSNISNDLMSFIPSNLSSSNLYKVHFNCNVNGVCSNASVVSMNLSNQAAIFKQGEAVGIAMQKIMAATGKNKVVLIGHSMGGLAIREYLQNSVHWTGNQHQAAKVVTVGTPNTGSNFELGGFAVLGEFFLTVDNDSEAVRDLRNITDGLIEWNPAVYLWGGWESQDYMYDDLIPWYNVDVNCNGTEGNSVTGLNERSMPANIEFASVGDNYDLVVTPTNAPYTWVGEDTGGEDLCSCLDLGWTGNFNCESWNFDATGSGPDLGHSALASLYPTENLWALDEPDDYSYSYEVGFGIQYAGFITPQASNGPYTTDWDDFKIYVPSNGVLTVSAEFVGDFSGDDLFLYEPSSSLWINQIENVSSQETMTTNVSSGWHIVEFHGTQTTSFSQYFFQIDFSPYTGVEPDETVLSFVYPNPSAGLYNIMVEGELSVFNSMGEIILSQMVTSDETIDLSHFSEGVYTIRIETQKGTFQEQVVKH